MNNFTFLANYHVKLGILQYIIFFIIPDYILLTVLVFCSFVFPKSLKIIFYGEKSFSSLFLIGKETSWKYNTFLERKASLFSFLIFSYGVNLRRSCVNNWKVYPLPLRLNEILEVVPGTETFLWAAVWETKITFDLVLVLYINTACT